MACFGNFVCFNCRVVARRPTWRRATYDKPESVGEKSIVTKCQHCGSLMYFLGPTIKVPSKKKVKEWTKLHEAVFAFRRCLIHDSSVRKVKSKHLLEKEIQKIRARAPNRERDKLIKELQNSLNKYT